MPRFRVRSVLFELPSSPDATMFDERGAVRSNCDSRSKLFRGCQYTQSSYLRVVLSIGERRQGAAVFFQRHHKASILARECRHQVILPQKRSFANAGRIKPGRARVRRRRRAFSRRRHRSLREMAEVTAGGVDAKLVRPSIQRICWLDGIGRGRAPHTAHVAYGSWLRGNSETEFANRKFVPTSINLKNESAGDGRGDKTIEKTILRTFRARTFSRSQGQNRKNSN